MARPISDQPIFVTGIGLVTSVGIGGRDIASRAREGLLRENAPPLPGEAEFPLEGFDHVPYLGKKGLRHFTRGSLALMAAARLAMDDAGREGGEDSGDVNVGVVAGTHTANAGLVIEFDRSTLADGPQSVNPALFPHTVWNSPSSHVAIRFGFQGPNLTVSTGWNSGVDALVTGADSLRRRGDTVMLAGGFEELTSGFRVLLPSVPRRAGLSLPLSEGAALVVLESSDTVAARGAAPLARIEGGKSTYLPARREREGEYASVRRDLVKRLLDEAGGASGRVSRVWHLDFGDDEGRGGESAVESIVPWENSPPEVIDLLPLVACAGGLTGALAAALSAAPGDAGSAPGDRELLFSEDGCGRMAALLVERCR